MSIDSNGNGRSTAMVTERDALGGSEIVSADGASGPLAQAMVAQVQARYVMAMRNPRNWDQVRQNLRRECERPNFAAAGWYRKPIGQGVEGFSIRFVEAALRIMKNVLVDAIPVSDDEDKRVFMIVVTDLESNTTYSEPITCTKAIERKKVNEGDRILSKRKNSYNEWTYLVPSTDDEILNRVGALKSKAIRTAGMRLIPGDLLDECKALMFKTRRDETARDPDAARKSIVDSFESLRVPASFFAEYLGHDLGSASPAELDELRSIFAAIRDGEASWMECLAASPHRIVAPDAPKDPKAEALREKLAAKGSKKKGTTGTSTQPTAEAKPASEPA